MVKWKIILGAVVSTPLLFVAAATTALSNDDKISLKDDASIAGMKIWKMEEYSNGEKLSADDSYYGVIVPLGTNIRKDTIKSLFKDSINLNVNFETSFQKDKEGTFNIKIQKDQTEIKMKIFVINKIWTSLLHFQKLELPKEFAIPEGVTSIGDRAFSGTTLNKSFAIPKGVKSIGVGAFYSSKLNNSFTIPKGVASIGNHAFSGTTLNKSFAIPEGVTSIGDRAFSGTTLNKSFAIHEGVTSIGDVAFYLAKLNDSFAIPKGVTSIGKNTFSSTILNKSFAIPEGVTSIGECAFYSTTLNDSFAIPEGVTSIGYGAFANANFSKLNGQKLKINFSTKVNKDSGLIFKEKQGKAQNAEWVYSGDQLWNDLKLKTEQYDFNKNISPSQIIKPKENIITTDGISINFNTWQIDNHKKEIVWTATLKKDGASLDISGNFNVDFEKSKNDAIKAIKGASTIDGVKALASSATEGSGVEKNNLTIANYNASTGELNKKYLSKTSIALFTIGSIFGLVVLVYIGSIVWKKYKIKN